MIPERLSGAAQTLLGAPIRDAQPLHGGDLSEVMHLTLRDGRDIAAKLGAKVSVEARMLKAMARTGAPVPTVLATQDDLLFLEYLSESHATSAGWKRLGAGLRQLHDQTGDFYGWEEDYAFGAVTITNAPKTIWPDYWATHRLLTDVHTLPMDIANRLEALASRLPDMLPATPPAALLHGDLWSGNILFDRQQKAWLIDPACYFGHSEVDLAMLYLFATPPDMFWQGYRAPDPGWRTRLPIYQLWPALVHLRLFGTTYQALVTRLLDTLKV